MITKPHLVKMVGRQEVVALYAQLMLSTTGTWKRDGTLESCHDERGATSSTGPVRLLSSLNFQAPSSWLHRGQVDKRPWYIRKFHRDSDINAELLRKKMSVSGGIMPQYRPRYTWCDCLPPPPIPERRLLSLRLQSGSRVPRVSGEHDPIVLEHELCFLHEDSSGTT
jgi:hypothetical protein